jgi:BirA family biotin operon repressor/biotin-[acetyl-CoA-carboxylase] ligase
MDEARALALADAPHGSVVVAQVQRAGRGRSGREWLSPPGNLYMTAILRPNLDVRRAPELGFVVAVALADAVDKLAGAGSTVKWPNDVLRRGAKLAGILLERLDGGAVLAGLGVNVAHAPADMPYPVTSLAAEGCYANTDSVLTALLRELAAGWDTWQTTGFDPVRQRWAARGPQRGAPLQVRLPGELVSGRFAGLAADGALLLDTAAGRRVLVAGDVLL